MGFELYDKKLSVLSQFIIGESMGKTDYLPDTSLSLLIGLLGSQPLNIHSGLTFLGHRDIWLDLDRHTVTRGKTLKYRGKPLSVSPFNILGGRYYSNTQIARSRSEVHPAHPVADGVDEFVDRSKDHADQYLSADARYSVNRYHLNHLPSSKFRLIPHYAITKFLK